jgi:hypothetical protein
MPSGSGGKRGRPWACRSAAARPSRSKRPGSPVSGFGPFTVATQNHSRINMRSKSGLFTDFRGMTCGQFRIPLHAQGSVHILPVKRTFTSAAWRRDPQHFHCARTGLVPFCTSHPHAYAHSRSAVLSQISQPAADLRARTNLTRLPRRTPGPAWVRSREKAPTPAASPDGRPREYVGHAHLDPVPPRRRPLQRPWPVTGQPARPQPRPGARRGAPRRTPGSAAGQRPRPVPGDDRGTSR